MLDTTTITPALLPQQAAAPAYERCQAPSGSRPVWCVVASLPRAERTAHAELHRRGYPAYLPLCTIRWRDRTWHTQPLFTGYLFVKMRLDQPWNPVRLCPGVYSLLLTDGKPGTVADAVLDALRAGDALRASPMPAKSSWAPGMACRLGKPHAMADLPAVITHVAQETANIAVMMFGHLRNILVPLDCLETRGDHP